MRKYTHEELRRLKKLNEFQIRLFDLIQSNLPPGQPERRAGEVLSEAQGEEIVRKALAETGISYPTQEDWDLLEAFHEELPSLLAEGRTEGTA